MAQASQYLPHIRALLVLGTPLIGGHLAQMAIGLTDTIMLGWYGVPALAAAVLAQGLFFTLLLMGSGFAWAVMPLVASASADGDVTASRRLTRAGLWISMLFCVAVMPLFWFSETLFLALGQEPSVSHDAATYLRIAGFGIFPALAVMVLKSFLAALEDTRAVFWIMLVAALANAGLNWVLIFGNLGLPELGLVGAAMASVLTQTLSLIVTIWLIRRRYAAYDLFRNLWRNEGAMLARVVRLGWPIGLTTLAEVGLFSAATILMGWLGTIALAAHGIALQIASLFFMFHLGLSNAATVRAGQALARQDTKALSEGAVAAAVLSACFAAIGMACMMLMPEGLISLFLDPDEPARADILIAGVTLLLIAAVFQLVDGQQVIALGVLRGLQDARVPMLIAVVSYWGIGLGTSLALGFGLGFGGAGVWWGLVLGLLAAAVLLNWRLWSQGHRLLKSS